MDTTVSLPVFTWVGHPPLGDQLGEQDAEGPHVRLDGELAVQRCLRSGPLDGELGSCRGAKTQTLTNLYEQPGTLTYAIICSNCDRYMYIYIVLFSTLLSNVMKRWLGI